MKPLKVLQSLHCNKNDHCRYCNNVIEAFDCSE